MLYRLVRLGHQSLRRVRVRGARPSAPDEQIRGRVVAAHFGIEAWSMGKRNTFPAPNDSLVLSYRLR
jgi:hypothetical protein